MQVVWRVCKIPKIEYDGEKKYVDLFCLNKLI